MEKEFGIGRMLEIQQELQKKYEGIWEPIGPDAANDKLLWGIGEMGEVIQILKKRGAYEVVENPETRRHFIEEMCDVYMYMADVLNCCSIRAEEVAEVYEAKHAYNMRRDYGRQSQQKFEKNEDQ